MRRLVVIEGVISRKEFEQWRGGPVQNRIVKWVDQLHGLSGRLPKKYASLDEAWRRMCDENKRLTPAQARHLTVHGVNQNEDGTFSWKFDNYVRAFAPYGLSPDETTSLWSSIACPTMLVHGADSWMSNPESSGSLAYFKNAQAVTLAQAGHWVHHDRLEEFLGLIRPFLKEQE